jgi:CelD/BcsL family acetyltransferase involved in cellulose biosynthesis
MQDALATWPDRRDLSFALREPSGRLVAVIPLHSVESPRARRIPFVRPDSLGGPAVVGDASEGLRRRLLSAAMDQVLRLAGQRRTTRVDVALPPLAPAFRGDRCPRVNPLLALGMANTLTQTWVVDLRDGAEAAWRGMQGRARTAIRKAENAGVTVRAGGAEDLDAYYALHRATYARTGATALPRAYFAAIWEAFLPAGASRVLLAEHEGRIVAARNFAVDKAAAVCWTAASDADALRLGANNLLQWRAMEWMIDAGIQWSETGEAFPAAGEGKAQGLSQFKESFGGELYPIYRGRIEFDQPLVRRLDGARALLRRRGATPT